ncbi:hypothetical protein [Dactylosporangium salmoneum]|uniref:Uncharacterized protein n=1 Tax=Dactylosporangium salmoneum TaxID=53361 RepID=A0ABN3GSL4_9ACTN
MNTISYCRGYLLGQLRRFPGWDAGAGLGDDTVVYLKDDLTVVAAPAAADEGELWRCADPRWSEFCARELGFDVPQT